MDFLNLLLKNAGSARELGNAAGIDEQDAMQVAGRLLPALQDGLRKNLQQGGGVEALSRAMQNGDHQRYIDNPSSLTDAAAVADGNGILGHLLGGKDASRQLAAQVSGETGVDAGAIKKMLPLIAAMAMGTLSKQTGGGKDMSGGLGDLLGGLDNDTLGAVAGFAKKFL